MIYKNSTMWTYYGSDEGATEIACEVRIDGDEISVSYLDDGGPVVYTGRAVGVGHFRLECTNRVKGRATLHRFDDDDVLEGSWIEDGYEGMWRIQID